MKELFQELNFRPNTLERIETANDIIEEYQADGLRLSLRQLYYQFVARGLLENTKKNYSALGDTISKGRVSGLIDWDAIEDHERYLRGRSNWASPDQMLRYQMRQYSIDMWRNQEVRLEVWIEKNALIGVIGGTCRANDVDYFACRGYASQSELYKAGKRIKRRYEEDDQHTVVIHLGDHDPSGLDMTRDNLEKLWMFSESDPEVRRIALNMEQVEQYSPPPNVAKETDSRYGAYVDEYGEMCWELDALEPRVMTKLIQDTIDEYKDPDIWQESEDELQDDKSLLNEALNHMNSI